MFRNNQNQAIKVDEEKTIQLSTALNENEKMNNPYHGSQSCPPIRAQVAAKPDGQLDLRSTNGAFQLRNRLLENGIQFSENKTFKAHHFVINPADFDKLTPKNVASHDGQRNKK